MRQGKTNVFAQINPLFAKIKSAYYLDYFIRQACFVFQIDKDTLTKNATNCSEQLVVYVL